MKFLLLFLFWMCLFLGAGPGVVLVNQADSWFGWPRVYVWSILWWLIQIAILLTLNRTSWKKLIGSDADR